MPATEQLRREVITALDRIIDPCSVGRGVPAGLPDMGLVCDIEEVGHSAGRTDVRLTLRLTAPGCTFQMYFDQQVQARLHELPAIGAVEVVWSDRFDWSDDDLSDDLQQRLRDKRRLALIEHRDRLRTDAV